MLDLALLTGRVQSGSRCHSPLSVYIATVQLLLSLLLLCIGGPGLLVRSGVFLLGCCVVVRLLRLRLLVSFGVVRGHGRV